MRDDRFSIDIPKRWLRRAVIALAVGMLVLPAAAWAGHQFTDVPDSNIFHEDIDWMADEGVTRGCNPPENTEFCPEENVTREQMSAFLHRMDTENVFVTPEEADETYVSSDEADAEAHFAVIDDCGDATANEGLESSNHDSLGTYTLDFATDVNDCSWTGAVGDRDGTPVPDYTVTLNDDADNNDVITALVTDEAGTLADEDFNVTINC